MIGGSDVIAHLDAAHDAVWQCVDPALLEVCRDFVAGHLGADRDLDRRSDDVRELDPGLRAAAIAFTEQFLVDVSGVTDEQVAPLQAALGDQGLVDFLHALLVVEQRMRLELIWDGVL